MNLGEILQRNARILGSQNHLAGEDFGSKKIHLSEVFPPKNHSLSGVYEDPLDSMIMYGLRSVIFRKLARTNSWTTLKGRVSQTIKWMISYLWWVLQICSRMMQYAVCSMFCSKKSTRCHPIFTKEATCLECTNIIFFPAISNWAGSKRQ